MLLAVADKHADVFRALEAVALAHVMQRANADRLLLLSGQGDELGVHDVDAIETI